VAAVLKVTEDIRLRMKDGQVTVLVRLDFSQAFDMVIQGLLLRNLTNLQNYSDGARMLLGSYLNGKTQFVRCVEKKFSVGNVTCDVPQRLVLGPLLFVSYIDDVSRAIKYSWFHIYADDLQIYHSSSVLDLQRCYDEINMDLQQIHEWPTANGLMLNPEKSQVILIHRSRADVPLPTLLIGANVVNVVLIE
jgi:hypothetical protein